MKKLNSFFKNFGAKNKGFTLIEILVVIGIIAVLATIVLIAINPARQFAQARDTQRTSNVETIINAVGQKLADCKGKFDASSTECPSSPACPTITPGTTYSIATTTGSTATNPLDLSCLVPTYVPAIPTDPSGVTAPDTGYKLLIDSTTKRTTVSAPAATAETAISSTPPAVTITR